MVSLVKARTRCMSGEVQYYHEEMYTWDTEDEWREKERQRVNMTRLKMAEKREMVC